MSLKVNSNTPRLPSPEPESTAKPAQQTSTPQKAGNAAAPSETQTTEAPAKTVQSSQAELVKQVEQNAQTVQSSDLGRAITSTPNGQAKGAKRKPKGAQSSLQSLSLSAQRSVRLDSKPTTETIQKPSTEARAAQHGGVNVLSQKLSAQLDETKQAPTTDRPGTLATESTTDNNVNCLDRAHEQLQKMDPATRNQSQMVFLRDKQNLDGNDAGHVMIQQPDGKLIDPNRPGETTTMEALQNEGKYEPVMRDGKPYTMPANQYNEVMSQPPGQRDLSGIPDEVKSMRLADGPAPTFPPDVKAQVDLVHNGRAYQRRDAYNELVKMTNGGNKDAQAALRHLATAPKAMSMERQEAAEALGRVDSNKLQAEDYPALAQGMDFRSYNNSAEKALLNAAGRGETAALDAIRSQVEHGAHQDDATRLMANALDRAPASYKPTAADYAAVAKGIDTRSYNNDAEEYLLKRVGQGDTTALSTIRDHTMKSETSSDRQAGAQLMTKALEKAPSSYTRTTDDYKALAQGIDYRNDYTNNAEEMLLAGAKDPKTRDAAMTAIREQAKSKDTTMQEGAITLMGKVPSEAINQQDIQVLREVASGESLRNEAAIKALSQHAGHHSSAMDALVGVATSADIPSYSSVRDKALEGVKDHVGSLNAEQTQQLRNVPGFNDSKSNLGRSTRRILSDAFSATKDPAVKTATADIALTQTYDQAVANEALPYVEQQARKGDTKSIDSLQDFVGTYRNDRFDIARGHAADTLLEVAWGGNTHAKQALTQVMSEGAGGSGKDLIADRLRVRPELQGLRNEMVDQAIQSPNRDFRASMVKALPESPISTQELGRVNELYTKKIQEAIKNAPEGSKVHEFGRLMSAAQLANQSNYRDRIDRNLLNKKIADISKDPAVVGMMRDARSSALREVMPEMAGKANASEAMAQTLDNYVRGDDFRKRLELMSPYERNLTMRTELQKLGAMDPQRAATAAQQLVAQQVTDNGFDLLANMPAKERTSALAEAITSAENVVGRLGTAGAGTFAAQRAQQLSEVIDDLKRTGTPINRASIAARLAKMPNGTDTLAMVNKLEQRVGGMKGLASAAALSALVRGGGFENLQQGLGTTANLFSLAGNAEDVARALGHTFKIPGPTGALAGRLAGLARAAEFLGPLGDAIGAGLSFAGAVDEFQNGDIVGGVAKVTGGVAGVAGAGAGIAIAAGASGPLAPAVLAGAAIVGLGSWLVDELWGENPQETMLRQLGVLQD